MHRRLQFGMRENPASDPRHGSRFAVSTKVVPNSIAEKNAQAPNAAVVVDPVLGGRHPSEHTAPRQAATGERRDETYGGVSSIRAQEQLTGGIISPSHIAFEPLLDIIDAAKLLRIHPKTLRAKAARGIIPGIQIGRVWRFRASMLDQWLAEITNRGRG